MYAPAAAARGVRLSVALDPSVPATALMDGVQLRQILGRLLSMMRGGQDGLTCHRVH
jgi:signal transduction histidine kinase